VDIDNIKASAVTNDNCVSVKNNISYSDHSIGSGDNSYFFLHQFRRDVKTFLLPSVALPCSALQVL